MGNVFYNPDDPELFVEKKYGFGQTFNMAHKQAYYLLLFLIIFPIAIIVIPLYLLVYNCSR
ncbi:DUF5808 domain-containing protein [Arcticibacter eurypsychrophilus]|uniref:DUF5808 domain-containing protein n=1 Tax=Arcticibacter eurypsychrophilus TaxID=1434752 RepID=UPI00373FD9ED